MATVFKWILDPPSSLGPVSDEFAIGDFPDPAGRIMPRN
jgi:hypothetical protein